MKIGVDAMLTLRAGERHGERLREAAHRQRMKKRPGNLRRWLIWVSRKL